MHIDLDDVDITSDPTLNIVSVTPPAVEEEVSEALVDEDEDSDTPSDSKEDTSGEWIKKKTWHKETLMVKMRAHDSICRAW